VDTGGFCLGEALVDDNSNEITAVPQSLNIKGHIATTDAMGCHTDIGRCIRKRQADCMGLEGETG
jgi:predicted transposase YbfD/YdcC